MTNPQRARINSGLAGKEAEFIEIWTADTNDTLMKFTFSPDGSLLEAYSGSSWPSYRLG